MLQNILLFLISTLLSLYVYVLVLRLVLQAVRARFNNPLSQFAIKFTQPIVKPLQKIVPEFKGIDFAVILLIFIVTAIKFSLVMLIGVSAWPNIWGLLILCVGEFLRVLANFYFYVIIIRVILSWITPVHHNPLFFLLTQMTEPLLYPIRRIVPLIGGFDLSPLIVLIVLQLFELVVVNPILHFGALLV